jgi:hypothetical protein
MDRRKPPLRWMALEARKFGLRTAQLEAEFIKDDKIEIIESLTGVWWILEIFPLKRLTLTRRVDGKCRSTYKFVIGFFCGNAKRTRYLGPTLDHLVKYILVRRSIIQFCCLIVGRLMSQRPVHQTTNLTFGKIWGSKVNGWHTTCTLTSKSWWSTLLMGTVITRCQL